MWSFVTSTPATKRVGFKQRYTVVKDVCEDILKLEKESPNKLKGHIVLSSANDKTKIPISCEKYVVENDIYILFNSAKNLSDICSNLSTVEIVEEKFSKICLSRMGWFTK